ncbi:MAG: hypothetical protein J0M04_17225 [Verrucomicrobia bacterium]|nr:hypothetical protein [Verrucomicrobiota bacterium]
MSAKPKKAASKGKRYTDTEKQAIVSYVNDFNAKNGRGGQAAAVKKYGVSALTITGWLKTVKPAKAAAAPAPAPAKAPVKTAKPTPIKPIKRAKVPQGTRYTDEQKKVVLDFVAAVNEKKGRGGMTAAARKFKVTPLTISNWLAKQGGTASTGASKAKAKEAKAAAAAVTKALAKLAKAEKALAQARVLLAAK